MAREMKDSGIEWIGEIPQNWNICRIKNCICERTSGAWGNEPKNNKNDVICLRIADFDYTKFRFKNTPESQLTIRNYDDETIDRLKLSKGDILIEKSGGGEKTPVGRTVIFDKEYTAIYANFMDRLRCSNFVLNNWMQFVFVTFYKNDYSRNYIKQTTGIQNLDLTSLLSNERITVPSLSEQKAITDFLDTQCVHIDSVIEKTRAAIEEYKRLKQSVITQAVTKGIRPNREMKDSGIEWIGELPKEWDITVVGRLCFVTKLAGFEYTKEMDGNITLEGEVPIVRAQNIKMGQFIPNDKEYISLELSKRLSRCALDKRCLLITFIGAGIGETALYNNEIRSHLAPNVAKIVINDDMKKFLIEEYLLYFFMSFSGQEEVNKIKKATAQPSLSMQTIRSIKITLPRSVFEQSEIVAYLDEKTAAIDTLIQKKEQLISELEAYKKSLIYEYVTGKKEVPVHAH